MSETKLKKRALNLRLLVLAAAVGVVITGTQAAWVALTGEELCVGGGCAVVASLTRIPATWFNLVGSGAFLLVALLGWLVLVSRSAGLGTLLHAVLASLLAAEGVLFAYQLHVAGAWCTYCLFLLGLIALLNLVYRPAGMVYGLGAFVATASVFSLLSFVPAVGSIRAGTLAVLERPGGPKLHLIFSENCPHCRKVEEVLQEKPLCTVRFNPVSAVSGGLLPQAEATGAYDPRLNLALARLLAIDTVPILIAEEPAGWKVVKGEGAILRYVEEHCSPERPAPDAGPWGGGSEYMLSPPGEDGCGLNVNCD